MGQLKESALTMVGKLIKLACLLAVLYFVLRCIDDGQNVDDVSVKPTPVVIESIKPIGQLYAFSTVTEDFAIDNVEKTGFFSRSYYKAVQTLRMQVSFVMDLDSVEYVKKDESGDTVIVRLPPLRYVQSAQGSAFICEEEIDKNEFNANRVIGIVEHKIRSKYDTPVNRERAMTRVKEVLTAFVNQCGLVPKFENKR